MIKEVKFTIQGPERSNRQLKKAGNREMLQKTVHWNPAKAEQNTIEVFLGRHYCDRPATEVK